MLMSGPAHGVLAAVVVVFGGSVGQASVQQLAPKSTVLLDGTIGLALRTWSRAPAWKNEALSKDGRGAPAWDDLLFPS